MEIEGSNNNEKYILLVDSHNSTRTFGVARSKEVVKHNKLILELPPNEFILNEIDGFEDKTVQFSFGKYIVVYFIDSETFFFIDYNLEVDRQIIELLLQFKVTDTWLELFFNIQFRMYNAPEEDIVLLQRSIA